MICISEEVSIKDCVKYGIDSVIELIMDGPFCGDLVRYISDELKKNYPGIDGKSDKIARSLYWVLTNGSNSPIESFFWVKDLPHLSLYSVSHEYIRRNDTPDKTAILKKTIDEYIVYIES